MQPPKTASLISIIARTNSPRLQNVTKFIFEIALQCRCEIVSEVSQARSEYKISYGEKPVEGCYHISSCGFLNETQVREFVPAAAMQNQVYVLFPTSESSFDIFSAVFFFVSRYEEWQAYSADKHGRFEAPHSFAAKQNWPNLPWVDIWLAQFKLELLVQYPNLVVEHRTFQVISTIDVDNLFAYKGKGLVRSIGASLRDALQLNFKGIAERTSVLLSFKKDPFDVYEEVADFCFEKRIPLLFFFLMRSGTQYDRSVKPGSKLFAQVIKTLKANMAFVGLHPSYQSSVDADLLNEEISLLKKAGEEQVEMSRQHFLRFKQQTTPKQLLAAGIKFDFTCGYATQTGFRAGTTLPFYYYDFTTEQRLELVQVPFCAMDGVWSEYGTKSTDEAYDALKTLATEIKKVNGLFITVYHERSFSDHLYKGFGTLYKKIHSELTDA